MQKMRVGQLAKLSLEEGLALIRDSSRKLVLDGETIYQRPSDAKRLKTFLTGLCCRHCGRKAEYFAIEVYFWQRKDGRVCRSRPYLNLYGLSRRGKPVEFTSDHVVPRARGGGNGVGNRQTLCVLCNTKKGSRLEEEI